MSSSWEIKLKLKHLEILHSTGYDIYKLNACTFEKAAAAGRYVLCQPVMTTGSGTLVDGC
jgi:hypothetical protein